MFLRYTPSSLVYTQTDPSESEYIPPTQLNFIDFSIPCKQINGSKAGPSMVASFLESIHFRKSNAATQKSTTIDTWINEAETLDAACEGDNEFMPSDEGYVSLYNYMKVCESTWSDTTLVWSNTVQGLKQAIHRYGCAIVEMYLANSFLTSNAKGKFDISSIGSGEIKVGDYTKAFVAFGYDATGVIVMNSLGVKWGSLGFARLAWSCFDDSALVQLPSGDTTRCFIKAASLKGCFN